MREVCAHGNLKRQCETCAAWESAVHNQRRAEKAEARVKELERERDHANMVADAAAEKIKELQTQRVPNPGVVGTLQNKNLLLEYKDAQIARLQARVKKLEARTSDKDSASGKAETT